MGIITEFKEGLRKGISQFTNEVKRDFLMKVNYEVKRIESKFIRTGIFLTCLMMGLLFISVAVCYFFIEYLELSRSISFLIVGVIILFIGVISKFIR